MKKNVKTSAVQSTTLKYEGVIKQLQKIRKPIKVNTYTFSKKNNVSTNLLKALQQLGHISKSEKGLSWQSNIADDTLKIAEQTRIRMNEITNQRTPTSERLTGPKAYTKRNGKTKNEPLTTVKKSSHTKIVKKIPTKVYTIPQKNTDKVLLAKKFSELGEYTFALKLLS